MAGILDSINTLLSPLGTNFALKGMLERCLATRTKAEERQVVSRCLSLAEERLRLAGTSAGEAARCLAMACFATTLGHDASFATVHAVKMAQNSSLAAKRVGYLSCSVLVREGDPLALLLVNTVARDLGAGPALAVMLALAACADTVPIALAPQLLPLVVDKLAHPCAAVRARAVAVLHRHMKTCTVSGAAVAAAVVPLLGDEDPAVASSTLPFIATVLSVLPGLLDLEALAEALVGFQRQVLQGRMPAEMRRRDISAPFAQAQAIRLLAACGSASHSVLQLIADTLENTFHLGPPIAKANANQNASVASASANTYAGADINVETEPSVSTPPRHREDTPPRPVANTPTTPRGDTPPKKSPDALRCFTAARAMVALECVGALAALSPSDELRETAAAYAAMLLDNADVNVRCAGLSALESLRLPAPAVTGLLRSDCATERRLALQLLAATTSASSAKAVCLQLAQHCHEHCANELRAKDELVVRAVGLIDEFPGEWTVPALVRLLALAPPSHAPSLRCRLQAALAPGTLNADLDPMRRKVLRALAHHAQLRTASTALLETFVWSLAHFPHLLPTDEPVSQPQATRGVVNQLQYAKANKLQDLEAPARGVAMLEGGATASDQWEWEAAMRGQQRLAELGLRAVRGAATPRLLVAVADAALRLVAAAGEVEPTMKQLVSELCASAGQRGHLRDCALELHACADNAARLRKALRPSREVVDPTLSAADAFVCRALLGGAPVYRPRPRGADAVHDGSVQPDSAHDAAAQGCVDIVAEEVFDADASDAEELGAWGSATPAVWSPGGRAEVIDPAPHPLDPAEGEDEAEEESNDGDDFERLAADIAAMQR